MIKKYIISYNFITSYLERDNITYKEHPGYKYSLKEVELTARDLAFKMTCSIRVKDWDDFPGPQKWVAKEETMAHLEHLYSKNKKKP